MWGAGAKQIVHGTGLVGPCGSIGPHPRQMGPWAHIRGKEYQAYISSDWVHFVFDWERFALLGLFTLFLVAWKHFVRDLFGTLYRMVFQKCEVLGLETKRTILPVSRLSFWPE